MLYTRISYNDAASATDSLISTMAATTSRKKSCINTQSQCYGADDIHTGIDLLCLRREVYTSICR